ncbi:MAG: septal ring lytic transglycosylase RlpA family protein [Bacteroidales bacterium]|nr:septal ring lytic transglycosylase RlpA family protein [Bacteroidales bacterium]
MISLFLLMIAIPAISQQKSFEQTGIASFYADKFEGRTTSNGEIYFHDKKTAAHPTLAFGSIVKVTNLENKKFVVVRINDRGPFIAGRIIDLSQSAAKDLGFIEKGVVKVKLEVIASTDDVPDLVPDIAIKSNEPRYYKIDVSVAIPSGKGVQIGSFKNDENVFRLAERLNSKYGEEVFIETTEVNGQRVYRVIVGNSTNEAHLQKLKSKLATEYLDCFIVTYKK